VTGYWLLVTGIAPNYTRRLCHRPGLMTHPALGSQVAGTVMDRVSDAMPALCLGMPPLPG